MDRGGLKRRLLEDFDGDEVVELASKLVKIPSVNPPGDTGEIASSIRDYLEMEGLEVEEYEPIKGKVSLVSRIGKRSEKCLILNGHIDVVPIGDRSRWSFNPFSGATWNGYLHGRGASDMKGGLAGLIYTFRKLVKYEGELSGELILMCVADEETGGTYGTGYLLREGKIRGSSALIAEPTGLNSINIGEKGAIWARVIVKGEPGHGSLSPFIGENAIIKAVNVIHELLYITELKAEIPGEISDVAEHTKNLIRELVSGEASKVVDHPTINFGIIRGGTKVNIIPDRCELEIDVRVPIGMPAERVVEKIKEISEKYGDVEFLKTGDPNYTPPSSEIVKVVERNVAEILGVKPIKFVQWASSDARYFRERGISAIHYGPAEIEGIHGYDERVKIDDLINAAKIYLGAAADYLC